MKASMKTRSFFGPLTWLGILENLEQVEEDLYMNFFVILTTTWDMSDTTRLHAIFIGTYMYIPTVYDIGLAQCPCLELRGRPPAYTYTWKHMP